jgi:hypothetical protein
LARKTAPLGHSEPSEIASLGQFTAQKLRTLEKHRETPDQVFKRNPWVGKQILKSQLRAIRISLQDFVRGEKRDPEGPFSTFS